jgi:uncharacterized membrane protein YeaQ/YmgE (transglycosylase-associated protein family)
MNIITWLIVGLVAGRMASNFMRGSGLGVLGDIVLGIAGAFVGGWIFVGFGWQPPFAGLAGVIAVALLGAICLLAGLRLIRRATMRP